MLDIESIINLLISIISQQLYVGTFITAILEVIFPPIPTLVIFPIIGHIASLNELVFTDIIILGIISGSGSTVGSMLLYIFALKFGRTMTLKYMRYAKISNKKLELIENWFEKKGVIIVLVCRFIPILREAVSISAGILKMNKMLFFIYTFIGSCMWSGILIMFGYYFDDDIQDFIKSYF